MVQYRLISSVYAAAVVAAFAGAPANANIIKDTSTTALAQGFGAVPRLLTVQSGGFPPPPATLPEVACDGYVGGAFTTGPTACGAADATFQGNGLINNDVTSGPNKNSGDVSPSGQSDKNNPINLSSLGITNANQIRINYNPSQTGTSPQSDILDLTLKFYDSSHNLVISIDGGCGTNCNNDPTADPLYFADTGVNLGNGGVGFILMLDATQANAVNNACGANLAGCSDVTAETQIEFSNDGPDSFTLFDSDLALVPEPGTLALLGTALAGLGVARRRRRPA